jgi:hypothetical protein
MGTIPGNDQLPSKKEAAQVLRWSDGYSAS